MIQYPQYPIVKEYTLNLAQAANTYDITTAVGDCMIEGYTMYMATAGATFTSLAIKTNDTTAFDLLTAAEGVVASLPAQKTVVAANKNTLFRLTSGKKLQFTLVGSTGTGSMILSLKYRPISVGATM